MVYKVKDYLDDGVKVFRSAESLRRYCKGWFPAAKANMKRWGWSKAEIKRECGEKETFGRALAALKKCRTGKDLVRWHKNHGQQMFATYVYEPCW